MTVLRRLACLVILAGLSLPLLADQKPGQSATLSKESRMMLIRNLNAEFVFLRKPLPMGGHGVLISPTGAVLPGDAELRLAVMQYGAAGKIGDRVQITNITIKGHDIVFDINGGPTKKKKWYQHISVSGMGGEAPVGGPVDTTPTLGSFIILRFPSDIPDLTSDQVKKMLDPLLDFNSLSAAESFSSSMPPVIAKAIKEHNVLVGMDRDMVIYAKGQPKTKIREKDADGIPYEEWIYGTPPEEVEFVRFVGDEVSRLEIMTVDGQKVVRTQKEVDINATKPKREDASTQPRPANAPSLRRPGEQPEKQTGPTVVQTRQTDPNTGNPTPPTPGIPGPTDPNAGPGSGPMPDPGGPPQDPSIPH